MKEQKRPRSSIRARRTACFSVSSSSRYMSLTSCRALSSWGCRSPFPGGVGRRGRAGDAGLARCICGSGPVVVSLAVAVVPRGPGDRGGQSGLQGLWRGWFPEQAKRTDRHAHNKDAKAAKPLGTWGELSPGQPQACPWNSCDRGTKLRLPTTAETSTSQDTLTAHWMAPPYFPG